MAAEMIYPNLVVRHVLICRLSSQLGVIEAITFRSTDGI